MAWAGSMIVVVVLLLGPASAAAHGLRLFASADGAHIVGSVDYADGSPGAGAAIRIEDNAGRVLARLSADANGDFVWTAQAPVQHRIVAEGADGHRAVWVIGADALRPGFADAEAGLDSAAPEVDPALLAAVERAVARQVAPLRAELQAAAGRARLHDIIGGIGWIIGVAGWAAWWRARRRSRP
jgi:nickel transport protein